VLVVVVECGGGGGEWARKGRSRQLAPRDIPWKIAGGSFRRERSKDEGSSMVGGKQEQKKEEEGGRRRKKEVKEKV